MQIAEQLNPPPADDVYLTGPQTRKRYGVSEMSLWRWLHNTEMNFPAPTYIAKRRYWRASDLIEWERNLPRLTGSKQTTA
jgi:predicted DNA-binding transcriptional regulator AlpA